MPEFVALAAAGEGLPVRVTRIEDVGRHKIIRCEAEAGRINAIVPEGAPVPAEMTRAILTPAAVNVYSDDWRVTPKSRLEEAA